ncbi:MAG: hypothetical protein KatS3mg105_2026 [Gemmatales bacterium]|nr:MAG: hypothetical protein KatS3mg105_2026 [Gemmatales bacterium]
MRIEPATDSSRLAGFSLLWRPETGIFLGFWLFLMVFARERLFLDPGTFWHTRCGQIMLDEGRLIRHDPFSFSFPQHPWLPHQWLGECLMAFLYRLGEWDTLLLAAVTTLAGLYSWLAHRLIRTGWHWSLALGLTVLVFAASSSHFHTRPHLATMVFFGLTVASLFDVEKERIRVARLFWLVPIYALWTNLHGGMLGGLATIGLVWIGWCAARLLNWPQPLKSWRDVLVVALIILLCGLAALANPYGWQLPQVWLTIMRLPSLTTIIDEHKPLPLNEADGILILLLAGIYLVVLFGMRSWKEVRTSWLVPLAWLYLAWTRVRHGPLFSIAAGLAIAEMFPFTRYADAIVKKGSDLFVPPPPQTARPDWRASLLPATLPALIVGVALCLQIAGIEVPVLGRHWARLDTSRWPTQLAQQLRNFPPGTPIFNDLNFGGYLIFFTPNLRVFIDDRCELYGNDFLLRYSRTLDDPDVLPRQFERWQKQYPFDLALVRTGTPIDHFLSDPRNGWDCLGRTEPAALYRRRQTTQEQATSEN